MVAEETGATQPGLFAASGPSPLEEHGSFAYVGIIKALAGEFQALRHLEARRWKRFTPLVEITEGRTRDAEVTTWDRSRLPGLPSRLLESVGREHPFMVDFPWLGPRTLVHVQRGSHTSKVRAIAFVFDELSSLGLRFIPVLRPGANDVAVDLARQAGATRGLAIRYAFSNAIWSGDGGMWHEIGRLADRAKMDPKDIDLILDLEYVDTRAGFTSADLIAALATLPVMHQWRSIALAGTSFPSSLGIVEEDSVGEVDRLEWSGWLDVKAGGLGRLPSFADYGIQHPTRPPRKMRGRPMRANIRYTSGNRYVIVRGRPLREVGIGQYQRLCKMLTARPDFQGSSTSWGDDQIVSCAQGASLDGTQKHWRAVGMSRHFGVVIDNLEALEKD